MHTVRHEIEPELSPAPRRPGPPVPVDPERKKKRMQLALAVLLITLLAVFVKNWDFWFPPSSESESTSDQAGHHRRAPSPQTTSSPPTASTATVRERRSAKAEGVPEPAAMAATTDRTALPDLQVEVVAGNKRRTVPAGNNAIHVDLTSPASSSGTQVKAQDMLASSASHVQMSPQTAQNVNRPVAPDYPLLARQMKVQGAVILQALISREGSIQELQIVSGPSILAAAAREAVKQWHFKPYYQNGQPIETQARITVNFTISTN